MTTKELKKGCGKLIADPYPLPASYCGNPYPFIFGRNLCDECKDKIKEAKR